MSENSPDPFSKALAELLGPLSRAMVARGLTLGSATESMKQALLDAAIEAEGPGVSDSRISVMTGLHRKDVRRLRSEPPQMSGRKTANRMALLIGYWATAPDFQAPDGAPRLLGRDSDAEGPGFNELVRRVRLDVAPGTMLLALMDQGAVEELEGGRFRLVAQALVPGTGSEELVAAYRATLTAHMTAATHNLLADQGAARFFDRVVRYSHLSDASVSELEKMARSEAQAMLEKLNARALELQERDQSQHASGKFTAGAFVLPVPNNEDKGSE